MKFKGSYVAVPVNVHRVNCVCANPDVLKKAGKLHRFTYYEFNSWLRT